MIEASKVKYQILVSFSLIFFENRKSNDLLGNIIFTKIQSLVKKLWAFFTSNLDIWTKALFCFENLHVSSQFETLLKSKVFRFSYKVKFEL